MIKVTQFNSTGIHAAKSDDLATLLEDTSHTLWVDIILPDEVGVTLLRETFKFHPLSIEDTLNQDQRAKVEEYPGYYFTILNKVVFNTAELTFTEIDVFVGNNFVVTVHSGEEPVFEALADRLRRRDYQQLQLTPIMVLYHLTDLVVDSYFPLMDQLSDRIDNLEEDIIRHPSGKILNQIFFTKRALMDFWRILGQTRDMVSSLLNRERIANDRTVHFYFRDIYDHLLRILDLLAMYRDIVTSMVDLYMSGVSNRLNKIVNRLSVVTIVIGLLTVISGFYGMNFEHTWPPFRDPNSVPIVLGMMLVFVATALIIMKRSKLF